MASITLLTPNVSANGLGRADVLARLLAPAHKVTIVGPQFDGAIWEPLRQGASAPVVAIPMKRSGLEGSREAWRALRHEVQGDLAYVSKPYATLIHAATKAMGGRRSVALDCDDWEWESVREERHALSPRRRASRLITDLKTRHHRAAWNAWIGDRMMRQRGFAFKTVSNRFLQGRFGGELIVHARDTDEFDPRRFDPAKERSRLGLDGAGTVVMFLGTPRPYKGLEQLAAAVRATPGTTLAIVGADLAAQGSAYYQNLRSLGGDAVRFFPAQPFAEAARTIAAADVMAIPQADTAMTRAQMPAKLFDAMAMAKPIVASAVSDIPEILDGRGIVVPPGDADALAAALASLAADPERARRLGQAARQACVERYSIHAVRQRLLPLVDQALQG